MKTKIFPLVLAILMLVELGHSVPTAMLSNNFKAWISALGANLNIDSSTAGETPRRATNYPNATGFTWGGYAISATPPTIAQINLTTIHQAIQFHNILSNQSYIYTIFDSTGGNSFDKEIDMSTSFATITIRATNCNSGSRFRFMIYDGVSWFISSQNLLVAGNSNVSTALNSYTWSNISTPNLTLNHPAGNNEAPLSISALSTPPNLTNISGFGLYLHSLSTWTRIGDITLKGVHPTTTTSVPTGIYSNNILVTLGNTNASGGKWTTNDGTTWNTYSTSAQIPVIIGQTITLKAFATNSKFPNGPVTNTYLYKVATPPTVTMSPTPRLFTTNITVSLSHNGTGGKWSTNNGSSWNTFVTTANIPINLSKTITVRAFATNTDFPIAPVTNRKTYIVSSPVYIKTLTNDFRAWATALGSDTLIDNTGGGNETPRRDSNAHPNATGFTWGAFALGRTIALRGSGNKLFFNLDTSPGSYLYTLFDNSGKNTPNRVLDMSLTSAQISILSSGSTSTDVRFRILINDGSGWFLSTERMLIQGSTAEATATYWRSTNLTSFSWSNVATPSLTANLTTGNDEQTITFGGIGIPNLTNIIGIGLYLHSIADNHKIDALTINGVSPTSIVYPINGTQTTNFTATLKLTNYATGGKWSTNNGSTWNGFSASVPFTVMDGQNILLRVFVTNSIFQTATITNIYTFRVADLSLYHVPTIYPTVVDALTALPSTGGTIKVANTYIGTSPITIASGKNISIVSYDPTYTTPTPGASFALFPSALIKLSNNSSLTVDGFFITNASQALTSFPTGTLGHISVTLKNSHLDFNGNIFFISGNSAINNLTLTLSNTTMISKLNNTIWISPSSNALVNLNLNFHESQITNLKNTAIFLKAIKGTGRSKLNSIRSTIYAETNLAVSFRANGVKGYFENSLIVAKTSHTIELGTEGGADLFTGTLVHSTVINRDTSGNYSTLTGQTGTYFITNSLLFGYSKGLRTYASTDLPEAYVTFNLVNSINARQSEGIIKGIVNYTDSIVTDNSTTLFKNYSTKDYSLSGISSVAFDNGCYTPVSLDIMGNPRPSGGGWYDIGAYEIQTGLPTVSRNSKQFRAGNLIAETKAYYLIDLEKTEPSITKVFRSETPLLTLPSGVAPVGTIPAGETRFIDTTANTAKHYYYLTWVSYQTNANPLISFGAPKLSEPTWKALNDGVELYSTITEEDSSEVTINNVVPLAIYNFNATSTLTGDKLPYTIVSSEGWTTDLTAGKYIQAMNDGVVAKEIVGAGKFGLPKPEPGETLRASVIVKPLLPASLEEIRIYGGFSGQYYSNLTVEGSPDGSTWTVLVDKRVGTFFTSGTAEKIGVSSTGQFNYFRFTFVSLKDAYTTLYEVELSGTPKDNKMSSISMLPSDISIQLPLWSNISGELSLWYQNGTMWEPLQASVVETTKTMETRFNVLGRYAIVSGKVPVNKKLGESIVSIKSKLINAAGSKGMIFYITGGREGDIIDLTIISPSGKKISEPIRHVKLSAEDLSMWWNLTDTRGENVSSGAYIAVINVNGKNITKTPIAIVK